MKWTSSGRPDLRTTEGKEWAARQENKKKSWFRKGNFLVRLPKYILVGPFYLLWLLIKLPFKLLFK